MQIVAQRLPKIDLEAEMVGSSELMLKRNAEGWRARGRTPLGGPFDLRFERIEELIAFVMAWDGMGADGGVN